VSSETRSDVKCGASSGAKSETSSQPGGGTNSPASCRASSRTNSEARARTRARSRAEARAGASRQSRPEGTPRGKERTRTGERRGCSLLRPSADRDRRSSIMPPASLFAVSSLALRLLTSGQEPGTENQPKFRDRISPPRSRRPIPGEARDRRRESLNG